MQASGTTSRRSSLKWAPMPAKSGVVMAYIDNVPLHSDTYRLSVWLGDANMDYDQKLDVLEFEYISPRFYPQMPPLQVIGNSDFGWRWGFDSSEPAKLP